MTTESVLTEEQIQQAVQCITAEQSIVDGSVVLSNVNVCFLELEQAVLQSPEVQRLREDAGRYRVLRDEEYQMLVDDPCVTDDSFNTFFGEDLDKAVDALKNRHDAAMKEQP